MREVEADSERARTMAKQDQMRKALSSPAQSHQSLDGLPREDHLMAFAERRGRPCLFHIQSNLSNQPTHTHWLSLELDFLITAIKFVLKHGPILASLAPQLERQLLHGINAAYNAYQGVQKTR